MIQTLDRLVERFAMLSTHGKDNTHSLFFCKKDDQWHLRFAVDGTILKNPSMSVVLKRGIKFLKRNKPHEQARITL